jgi:TldD protein
VRAARPPGRASLRLSRYLLAYLTARVPLDMADFPQPERFFRDRYGVSSRALEKALGSALARRADYGDLYFEFRTIAAVALEDGLVKKASKDVVQGVGVRVLAGEKTGYAYSDDVTVASLEHAARTAGHIASDRSGAQAVAVRTASPTRDLYALPTPPVETPPPDAIALLAAVDREARRYDPRIKNVLASVVLEHKLVMIVTSDGTMVSDVQPLVRMHVTCIADDRGGRQQGTYGGGGRQPFAFLLDGDRHLRFTR